MTDQPNTEGFGTDITAEAVVENPTNATIPATSNTTTDSPVAFDAGNAATSSNSTTGATQSESASYIEKIRQYEQRIKSIPHALVVNLYKEFKGDRLAVKLWIEQELKKI